MDRTTKYRTRFFLTTSLRNTRQHLAQLLQALTRERRRHIAASWPGRSATQQQHHARRREGSNYRHARGGHVPNWNPPHISLVRHPRPLDGQRQDSHVASGIMRLARACFSPISRATGLVAVWRSIPGRCPRPREAASLRSPDVQGAHGGQRVSGTRRLSPDASKFPPVPQ